MVKYMENKFQYKFSVVMAIYNVESYLSKSINSVINQTLDFKDNIQLILVDDGSTDNSYKIASEFKQTYPENIVLLSNTVKGQANARNLGLKYIKGEYVNFLDSDDYLSDNALHDVYEFFKEHVDETDIISIPIELFGRISGAHKLNYKYDENGIIDLKTVHNFPQLSSSSSFFKNEVFEKYSFDTRIVTSEDAVLINKLLLEKMKIGVLNTATYYYRQRNDYSSTIDTTLDKKEYYNVRLKNYFIELIEYSLKLYEEVPKFIQYTLAYDLQWIIKMSNLNIFDSDYEKEEFWSLLNTVLDYIDDDVILENDNILDDYRHFMYYLKNKKVRTVFKEDNILKIRISDKVIDSISEDKVGLDVVEIRDNHLILSGMFQSLFEEDKLNVNIIKEYHSRRECIEAEHLFYNNDDRKTVSYLDIPWKSCYNFNVEIPITGENEKYTIEIEYLLNDELIKFYPAIFFNVDCNISTSSIYIVKDSHLLLYQSKAFHIVPYKYKTMLRYEYSCIKKIFNDRAPHYLSALFYHMIFITLYPLMKDRRIWLFADKPDFSDDNAKYLFKYGLDQNDDIRKYFVVRKDSADYAKLCRSYKNIVAFNSVKHRILYLFAEKYISSYINEEHNSFYHMNKQLYKGLLSVQRVFLQHGVTKDNLSKNVNKYRKNLYMITTVSEQESESFKKDGYNFNDKVIQCLGFPRYDSLSSDLNTRQILFMPTWRVEIRNENDFLSSDYFKMINNVINNEKLHEILDKNDYSLVFKPHPELLPFINLIKSDKTIISTNESYQELFKRSSLLITDFSSVFFDFGYLKKPVVYYQENNDYHYEQGYFNYENSGFGEITTTKIELTELIKEYISTECKMKRKYLQRVENFFKYSDNNNCKRNYEWLKNH